MSDEPGDTTKAELYLASVAGPGKTPVTVDPNYTGEFWIHIVPAPQSLHSMPTWAVVLQWRRRVAWSANVIE